MRKLRKSRTCTGNYVKTGSTRGNAGVLREIKYMERSNLGRNADICEDNMVWETHMVEENATSRQEIRKKKNS